MSYGIYLMDIWMIWLDNLFIITILVCCKTFLFQCHWWIDAPAETPKFSLILSLTPKWNILRLLKVTHVDGICLFNLTQVSHRYVNISRDWLPLSIKNYFDRINWKYSTFGNKKDGKYVHNTFYQHIQPGKTG